MLSSGLTDTERDAAREQVKRWRVDPAAWAKDVVGVTMTEPQRRFAESVVLNKRTVVRSANGTGKTHGAALLLLWFVMTRRAIVIATAPTWSHVKHRLWGEVVKAYRASKIPLGGELLPDGCRLKCGDKWEAFGLSTNDESNFQGGHAENLLIIFDEAQGIRDKIWEAAESMVIGGSARWLAIGNPLEPKGNFYKAFQEPDYWNAVTISALEHPNVTSGNEIIPGAVTKEWVEERLAAWGENDPRYQARVLGMFPEAGLDSVVPLRYLEDALTANVGDPEEGAHLGVDVARFGPDETVITLVRGGILTKERRLAGKDGNQVAGEVIQQAREAKIKKEEAIDRIHVDPIGVGASVVDAMLRSGWRVDSANFAAKPRNIYREECGDMAFANLRAELWWSVRELARRKRIVIPKKFGSTWSELIEPSYHYNSRGALVVEEKDKVKARLGRSPDGADAFVLALSRLGTRPNIFL